MIKKIEWPLINDLVVFQTVVKKNSFSKAADELGFSKAYITKRISILEANLNVKLFYRDTRNIKLTQEGEKAFDETYYIISQMKNFLANTAIDKNQINGTLHISSSLGFGRSKLAKPISLLKKINPDIDIKLTLTDQHIDLIKEDVDIEFHVGNIFKDTYYAKKIAFNKRILCASPFYLKLNHIPTSIEELRDHNCLFIQERNSLFGTWNLTNGHEERRIKVNGDLTSNSGEVILDWAKDGYGIVLRSHWDARQFVDSGELIQILPDWYEEADIWALSPKKISTSYKVDLAIKFFEKYFVDYPL